MSTGEVISFRDLIVWQKSMQSAVLLYTLTNLFPKHELFGLTSQLRRASVSVPSNIAEGHARNTTGEFVQFLGIANGSLAEIQTQIELAIRLEFIQKEQADEIIDLYNEVSKMIASLMRTLKGQ